MLSESVEEYLEAIYRLSTESESFGTGDLAALLGVAPPSVTTMLGRMTRDGLVTHERYGDIALTAEGEEHARRILRRHRLAERLLTDLLGLPWDVVHRYACELEHVFDSDLEQAVFERLAKPLLCPHGGRIAGDEPPNARPLSALNAGDSAVVVRVVNEDPQLLRYLDELGLVPGMCIEVESISPGNDLFWLNTAAGEVCVGKDAASALKVLTGDVSAVAAAICRELGR